MCGISKTRIHVVTKSWTQMCAHTHTHTHVFFGEISVLVFCPVFDWIGFFAVVVKLYELFL